MIGVAIATLLLAGYLAYAASVIRWAGKQTVRDAYFRRPVAERRALKARIGALCRPILPLLDLVVPRFRDRTFLMEKYEGFTAPGSICTHKTFAAAQNYAPEAEDVFVATQMKCGTTWMQQIVYEAVSRGKGDLGDDGHRHMYAISPWIESKGSVSMADAPVVGQRPTRIIKTHLPAQLCPYDERARYIYVLRHPVSCFASSVDFLHAGMGPAAPDRAGLLDWFCSQDMWWGPWADHAEGWWQWRDRENVLFLHYEAMKDDLAGAVQQVSRFLGLDLDAAELADVTRKSDYAWMKEHEEVFEMHAPTLFSGQGSFLKSGTRDRHEDARAAESERICRDCRERLVGASYPLAEFYPDVAAPS